MKAERRQELRTNELSQHLDKLGESFKRNSTLLTAVIVGALVVVMASYWYTNHRAATIDSNVAELSFDSTNEDLPGFIERCKAVAGRGISPEVTQMAWLRIGAACLGELTRPLNPADGSAPSKMSREAMAAAAKEGFSRALTTTSKDAVTRASAMFGLALLDEDAGNFDAARQQYEKIKADPSLADSPFVAQATYRLNQLSHWAEPVVFAAPPPMPEFPAAPSGASAIPGLTVPPSLAPTQPESLNGSPQTPASMDDDSPISPEGANSSAPESTEQQPTEGDAPAAPPVDDAVPQGDGAAPGSPERSH
ncbi:MAG: hypothetical protein KF841_02580 [Phycisphaerae bacterium]|nr:hypothetical protein [Phycisphaerae bacterium]